MSEKRRRDQCEYLREYRIKKKEKAMMSKREKSERYYMGKEDVKVVAATLAPPSPCSTLPSVPSFDPSLFPSLLPTEDASALIVEPRYSEGEILLLEANTKERGYVYLHFFFYFSLHAFVSLLGTKQRM